MYKILKYLIPTLLLVSCSSSSDGNIDVSSSGTTNINIKDSFDPKIALKGSTTTQELCSQNPDSAVWVVVGGKGECIRYFAHNIQETNDVAAFWMSGDIIQSRINSSGKNTGNSIGWYEDNSPQKLLKYAEFWKSRSSKPYVWLSRPGIYGSSGNHRLRRQPRNVLLMNVAITQIKAKYKIKKVALMGQSGGGHLVASLLSRRNDVECAGIGAGVVSVAERNRAYGWNGDITGYKTFVDPITEVENISMPNSVRVFVIGDKRDKVVPFRTMQSYYSQLAQKGIDSTLMAVQGGGKKFHQVQRYTSGTVADCLNGLSTQEIAARRNAEIVTVN